MTVPTVGPDVFYTERVPAHWNETLDAQARAADDDAAANALLADMLTVNATIAVVVEEGTRSRHYWLDIADGRMHASRAAAQPPFLTLTHDLETLATLERESGDSVLGFLGTLAGQPGEMRLTSTRLQNLLGLRGRARLELTGGAAMTLVAQFGDEPSGATAHCALRIASETFAALRAGDLAPQDAFMSGQIEVEGDMQLAMQLALAALSVD